MAIRIETQIGVVRRRLLGLPAKLRKELNKDTGKWMKSVQKSAKLRAPKDTRETRDSIVVTKKKNGWDLIVASKQGFYQEMGFKPHWIHKSQIGKTNNKTLTGKDFFFVRKSKPFVRPALEHNLSKLSQTLTKATKRAIGGKR